MSWLIWKGDATQVFSCDVIAAMLEDDNKRFIN